jgi:hypothetical protein
MCLLRGTSWPVKVAFSNLRDRSLQDTHRVLNIFLSGLIAFVDKVVGDNKGRDVM